MHDHFDYLLAELRSKDDRYVRAIAVRVALRATLDDTLSDNWHGARFTSQAREAWYFNLWLLLEFWIECVSPSNESYEFRDLHARQPWRFELRGEPDWRDRDFYGRMLGPSFHLGRRRREDDLDAIVYMVSRSGVALQGLSEDLRLNSDASELIRRPLYPLDLSVERSRRAMRAIENLLDRTTTYSIAAAIRDWYDSLLNGAGSLRAATYARDNIEREFQWITSPRAPRYEDFPSPLGTPPEPSSPSIEAANEAPPQAPANLPWPTAEPSPPEQPRRSSLRSSTLLELLSAGLKSLRSLFTAGHDDQPMTDAASRRGSDDYETTTDDAFRRASDTARYTDISIFSAGPGAQGPRVPEGEPLLFGRPYTIEVAIRGSPVGLPHEGERTDIAPLISQTDPSELLAVLTSLDSELGEIKDILVAEPVQSLIVPEFGDSTNNALFRIVPVRGSGATRRCDLVLRLYYKLDLIDQIRISVLIGSSREAKDPQGYERTAFLAQERSTELPAFARDLVPRSLNIVVSRPANTSNIRLDFLLREYDVHLVGFAKIGSVDLTNLLSRIRDQLLEFALASPADSIEIDSATYRDQLQKLAQLGEQAKQLLFDFSKAGSDASLRVIEGCLRISLQPNSIVQIAIDESAGDFQFPWSLLFGGNDPRETTKFSDFWGYRFIIEEKPASMALTQPSVGERRELSFAFWDKLKTLKAQHNALARGREALPPVNVSLINSRDQLLRSLKEDLSDILYIFAHGHSCAPAQPAMSSFLEKLKGNPRAQELLEVFRGQDDLPGLSEENDSWIKLTKSLVTCADLQRDPYILRRHPIVVLNMCQSAVLWPGVTSSFVRVFLNRGAAAVVGTECTIPETVADEFGRTVVETLFQGKTLGESFLHARLQLARANNLLGLAYSLYGSASAGLSNISSHQIAK